MRRDKMLKGPTLMFNMVKSYYSTIYHYLISLLVLILLMSLRFTVLLNS